MFKVFFELVKLIMSFSGFPDYQ